MNAEAPTGSGWYPDPERNEMRYWDGGTWTGDVRPRRRPFAAASAHRGWGIALLILGPLFVVTSPGQLAAKTSSAESTASPIGSFLFSIVLGFALTALGVYLVRGQGPSTKDVEMRLRSERELAALSRVTQRNPAVVVNVGDQGADRVAAAQIDAIANPQTAKALLELQNLLYTQTITDAEFQAAKDRLLGGGRAGQAAPGWFDDGSGRQRWWDGHQWTEHFQPPTPTGPLATFPCEVEGRHAQAAIFEDRVEWQARSGVSGAKVTAGVLTGGLSLAVTGLGSGSYAPGRTTGGGVLSTAGLRVTQANAGNHSVITMSSIGGTVSMRLSRDDTQRVLRVLSVLVTNEARAGAAGPVTVRVESPTSPTVPTPAAVPPADSVAQLGRLADLHQTGVLSDQEFAVAKARLLGL